MSHQSSITDILTEYPCNWSKVPSPYGRQQCERHRSSCWCFLLKFRLEKPINRFKTLHHEPTHWMSSTSSTSLQYWVIFSYCSPFSPAQSRILHSQHFHLCIERFSSVAGASTWVGITLAEAESGNRGHLKWIGMGWLILLDTHKYKLQIPFDFPPHKAVPWDFLLRCPPSPSQREVPGWGPALAGYTLLHAIWCNWTSNVNVKNNHCFQKSVFAWVFYFNKFEKIFGNLCNSNPSTWIDQCYRASNNFRRAWWADA